MTEIPRTSERHGFEEYYFMCDCSSDEHTIRFGYDTEEGELHMHVLLHQYHPWYERIWKGIRYVFGYQSKYGMFDSTIIRKEDADRLIALLQKVRDTEG